MDDNEKLVIALGSELNLQIEGMKERFKATLVLEVKQSIEDMIDNYVKDVLDVY